jgi:CheY-like chemotaxis protein
MNEAIRAGKMLMAEDDAEDQLLMRKAFARSSMVSMLSIVNDGEELLDFLYRRGPHVGACRPDIILLDLNMPRMDGREALRRIKADPDLRTIPVIVLTTSSADDDVVRSYNLGVNSYIEKPVNFERLVEIVTELEKYWFDVVRLPSRAA